MTLEEHETDTRITLRIPQDVHARMAEAVRKWRREERVGSVNAWIVRAIVQSLGAPAEVAVETPTRYLKGAVVDVSRAASPEMRAMQAVAAPMDHVENVAAEAIKAAPVRGQKKSAAEIAAAIPGVEVGVPEVGVLTYPADGPEEDLFDEGPGPVDWDHLAIGWREMEPGPVQEQVDEKLQERGKKRPKDWARKNAAQRMEWLKSNA